MWGRRQYIPKGIILAAISSDVRRPYPLPAPAILCWRLEVAICSGISPCAPAAVGGARVGARWPECVCGWAGLGGSDGRGG